MSKCQKYGKDTEIVDVEISTKFPDHWAILMDKGYQGAQLCVQAIIPKKSPMAKFHQLKMQVGMNGLKVIA